MTDFSTKTYGRNEEVGALYKIFDTDQDVAMPGPRRLGKSFVLDRMVDAAEKRGWVVIKIEVSGCKDARGFFGELCSKIGSKRAGGSTAVSWLKQRLGQVINPRSDNTGPWYQPLLSLDTETYFQRLIHALNEDKERRWALLIDELPIFLKAMHDQGPAGVDAARNFMNLTSRLRADYPRVRWLVTGSIGLEPLAHAGNYMGVLAKYRPFELQPLTEHQSRDFLKDLAQTERLMYRKAITDAEAQAIVDAVGWRAAYYLETVAQKLQGEPSADTRTAQLLVEDAVNRLLHPTEVAAFGVWEEHLRKHWASERATAFAVLAALAQHPQGITVDTLLTTLADPALSKPDLRAVLNRLHGEGFITITSWDSDSPLAAFRNPLLRRWWQRFQPRAAT